MSSNATALKSAVGTAKYLTVLLADEAYGLEVLKIREIIRTQKITPLPQMPEFIRGVLNLRGRVLPVLDLRLRLGLKAEFTERTCIVVVQLSTPAGTPTQMGLIVDSVEEVVTLGEADIEPTPDFSVHIAASCLLGLAKVGGQVKTLLDLDRLIADRSAP
jgi:purine-binding chemotaxis protein CheW